MAERAHAAIVLADGDVPPPDLLDGAWPAWADGVDLVVAADGGARHAPALGLLVDAWVGDGDSISVAELAALEGAGTDLQRVPVDKDQTDTELAIDVAIQRGAARITILGALGGPRLDHGLANVALLAGPALIGIDAVLYDARATRLSLITAPDSRGDPVERPIAGRIGDVVSLLPLADAARGVTTGGLRFPLAAEDLPLGTTRGVSNVRTATAAAVRLESGRLLVIETPVTVDR